MTRLNLFILMAFVLILGAISIAAKNNQAPDRLAETHKTIVTDYPALSHISRDELQTRLGDNDILIFDTRQPAEYHVSYIAGAVQLDPDIEAANFEDHFGASLRGKHVIVYCSVGRRSSILSSRLKDVALKAGAISVSNLEGGLFGWHNDKRPLQNKAGPTTNIHPYNAFWGRLIDNKDAISYKVEK